MYIEEVGFTGHVTLVVFNKVKEPISFKLADYDDFIIVANGFMWLQYFPSDAHHGMTAVINEKESSMPNGCRVAAIKSTNWQYNATIIRVIASNLNLYVIYSSDSS